MSVNSGVSLTQWLVDAGGGQDPSWATSTLRLIASLVGLLILYNSPPNVHLGEWHDEVALATHIAFAFFLTQFCIKSWKHCVDARLRKKRIEKGREWWRELSDEQMEILDEFARKGTQVLRVKQSQDRERLITVGALKPLSVRSRFADAMLCRIDAALFEYQVEIEHKRERAELRSVAKAASNTLTEISDAAMALNDIKTRLVWLAQSMNNSEVDFEMESRNLVAILVERMGLQNEVPAYPQDRHTLTTLENLESRLATTLENLGHTDTDGESTTTEPPTPPSSQQ